MTSWTLVENELANHLSAGKLLELKGRPATQRLISADCIRNLVRGRRPGEQPGTWVPFDADPRGLQLLGATVADRVDLDYITASTGITFIECNFPEGISAGRANLASLSLENCTLGRVDLEQPALTLLGATVNWHLVLSETTLTTAVGPALAADSVQVGGSTLLPGLHATGEGAIGTVRLAAARIGGQLILSGATITNANGPALAADNIRVDGLVRMANGFTANGEGENGAVRLQGGRLGYQLDLAGSSISNPTGPAFAAQALEVTDDAHLVGIKATGHGVHGSIQLSGARVGGQLRLSDASVANASGPALSADALQVGGDANLWPGFTAIGSGEDGAVRLRYAHIGGQLNLTGASLTNPHGPALAADGLEASGTYVNDGFTATGTGESGAVRLLGARTGQLSMDSATITNHSGPALIAFRLQAGDVSMDEKFNAIGAIDLCSARLAGHLVLGDARLETSRGPALHADDVNVEGNVLLSRKLNVVGKGQRASIRLHYARITGDLSFTDATITNSSGGPVLDTKGAVITGDLIIGKQTGQIKLTDTTVKGNFRIAPQANRQLSVDGLTYRSLTETTWKPWLQLLSHQTPGYTPQPYRQLASITAAAGHDSDTRAVLMAQRRDQLKRADLSRAARRWGRFTGFALGYGYQPWRALLGLLLAASLTATAFWFPALGGEGLHLVNDTATACSSINRIILGVDTTIPLITTSVGSMCLTSPTPQGEAITVIGVLAQLLGWATATLFIAGFTSVIRKT